MNPIIVIVLGLFGTVLLTSVTVFIALLPVALYRAWVLTLLWGWFVVPTFHLPALDLRIAFGLSIIVSLFTANPVTEQPESKDALERWGRILGALIGAFVGPSAALAVGWAVQAFF